MSCEIRDEWGEEAEENKQEEQDEELRDCGSRTTGEAKGEEESRRSRARACTHAASKKQRTE